MATTPQNPAAATLPEAMSMGAVLRVPAMRRMWYAQIVSTFGDFLALFAIMGVLTFNLHASPQQVTSLQIAYLLPIAVLGVIAGVFVDRWPLKPTLVSSDLIRAVLCLLLLFAHRIGHFYLIMASISVVSSFFGPAQGVAIRSIVPMHGLRSANALLQQVMFLMRIIGPGLAGVLVLAFGPRSCYYADAASFLGSACLITSIALARPQEAAPAHHESAIQEEITGLRRIWSDMKQGLSFIVHHAGLLFVILALAAAMFVIGCFGPLIAIYVRDTLHASNFVFDAASAMIGVGMLIGVNGLNTFGKKIPNATLVYAGLAGIAFGLIVLTSLPFVWATVLGDLIIGFAVAGIVVPSQTMIQQETPAALMGRVGSTVMSAIFGAQIGGLVLSGILANAIGVRHVFAACAVLLALLIAVGRLWMEPKAAPEAAA
jgi:DHA3 family macrolide efflux protein-like MFS transporter